MCMYCGLRLIVQSCHGMAVCGVGGQDVSLGLSWDLLILDPGSFSFLQLQLPLLLFGPDPDLDG